MRSISAGTNIGYVHTYVEKVRDKGRDYLRVRIDMEQRIKRGRDIAVTKLTYGTIETLDGQVLRLDTLTDAGERKIRTHGDVIRGEMKLIIEGTGVPNKKWSSRGAPKFAAPMPPSRAWPARR